VGDPSGPTTDEVEHTGLGGLLPTSRSPFSVSIAMATYNGCKHIQRQLGSLAAQTRLPTELVVTDDCSTDDTIAIVDEFAKSAPFTVKVIRNDARLGYRANFMRAANLCCSDLIAFCDQDDFWYSDKIAKSTRPFGDPEVLLSYHNADVVTEDGSRISSLTKRLVPISAGPWFFPLGFSEVFRRSLLQLSDLWPNSRDSVEVDKVSAHDVWFYFLAGVFGKVAYVNEPLVAYVQHDKNAYGFGNLNFRKRMELNFRSRATEIDNYAKIATNRAVILDIAKDHLDGIWQERAAASAEFYRKLNVILAERSTLYTRKNLVDRIRAFKTVLEKTGYAAVWGLGRRAFVVDTCLGIPIGPYLR
jgi:glycosyltransferase involved in cell wall biosynthesis